MQKFYKLPLVLDPQPEGGWTITCPVLPELITEADTWDEIEPNVSDCLQAVIEIHEYLKKTITVCSKSYKRRSSDVDRHGRSFRGGMRYREVEKKAQETRLYRDQHEKRWFPSEMDKLSEWSRCSGS